MDRAEERRATTAELPHRAPRGWGAALVMVGLIAALYLLQEHGNHVAGGWPYLVLLGCPLMHWVHRHGGHRGQVGHGSRARQE